MNGAAHLVHVAIACGGTGGHLFPGLAVAHELLDQSCAVTLLVSRKEVDQQGLRQAAGMNIVALPAVGLSGARVLPFMRGFLKSYRLSRKIFASHPPQAALAMGGFTSAPPLLAARRYGALTFLHESNTIPGRANRWLSWIVNRAFVGFPSAARRLHCRLTTVTGTPVRRQLTSAKTAECRKALGLDPSLPAILVMGGSQGATGVNQLVLQALPLVAQSLPGCQWLHLTGPNDVSAVRQRYNALKLTAVVHPFFEAMDLVLGAATVAISRAGASSMAELAALRVPSILVPYPAAADAHQLYNAREWQATGAAYLLEQKGASGSTLASLVIELVSDAAGRRRMQQALAQWHQPDAAVNIARAILDSVALRQHVAATHHSGRSDLSNSNPGEPGAAARLSSNSPAGALGFPGGGRFA